MRSYWFEAVAIAIALPCRLTAQDADANARQIYDSLKARLLAGDTVIDYRAFRFAYAGTAEYDPFGAFTGDATRASTTFEGLPQAVKPGDTIFLNDGLIQLVVRAVKGAAVRCEVVVGGALLSNKGINIPDVDLGIDAFTARDRECLAFALEQGSFVLTKENVTIPADTKEFAINMSNMRHWAPPVKRYVDECLAGKEGPRGKDFNMRWVASMVADVHRILTRGGIFSYPLDSKCAAKGGKLRLMYEANPMSLLVEQAGGAASTGRQRMLEVQPTGLHQRVPVFLGSKNEVEAAVRYHHEHDARA